MAFFNIRNLSRDFDGIRAVDGITFQLNEGQMTALIGPNGAGKTTLFNVITGFLRPNEGDVFFNNDCITREAPHTIARIGIGRTFQNLRLFGQMSVLENVMLALQLPMVERLSSALLHRTRIANVERESRNRALAFLKIVGLAQKRDAMGEDLSHGERRLLALARVLALDPQLLLLDEPTAGLSPMKVVEMKDLLRSLREAGKTVLFIEHNMNVVKDISERVIVLDYGRLIADGTPAEIYEDDDVIRAYLGRRESDAT